MLLSKKEFLYLVVIIAFAFVMLLLFFFIVIILNVKMRKQKEIEKLHAIVATQEHERKRIAEDMHDEIGPMLSAIKLQINAFLYSLNKEELEKSVRETSVHLNTVIQSIRNIVRNLSPESLRRAGLVQSIEELRGIIEKNKKIRFNFMHENIHGNWTETAEANIYRIIGEMINNSIKHSNCDEINLVLKMYEEVFLLVYMDNGRFKLNPNEVKDGMGLKNINSRLNLLNGRMQSDKNFSRGAFYYIVIEKNNLATHVMNS